MPDSKSDQGEEPTSRTWLVFFVLITCIYVAAATIRGRYLDEFWTGGFVDTNVPFSLAFEDWSADTAHPIGFYLFNRLFAALLPLDVFVGRYLNLLYLAAAVLVGWRYDKRGGRFGLLFCAALSSSYFVIERSSQFRATFLGLMILAVTVIIVRSILDRPRPAIRDGVALACLCAALGLVDYPLSIAAIGLCGGLGVVAISGRNWGRLLQAGGGAAANFLMTGASLVNTARYPMAVVPNWQPMRGLAFDLTLIIATALLPCILLILVSLRDVRQTGWPGPQATDTPFRRAILLSIFLTLAGYVLVNAAMHGLYRRQLFGIVPLIIAFFVDVGERPFSRTKSSWLAVMAGFLVVGCLALIPIRSKVDWDRFGPALANAQGSCASLPIYALLPERISHMGVGYPMSHTTDSRQLGYEQVARDYGFRLSSLKDAKSPVDSACGAIIWSETVWRPDPITPRFVYDQVGIRVTPEILARTRFDFVDGSLLLRIPPKTNRPPSGDVRSMSTTVGSKR